ncbi:hypothetical protein T4B_8823 [Trichinella pseudospiralis]|uniref:Uncharacterized protein n=1 Tax=Trichinella pseudospiralis TaxID=6337 RepID=A0A0V1J5H3_TRIPS|nr:hypothetical protein T4B_8823 [Trichinella pseudospiralis]
MFLTRQSFLFIKRVSTTAIFHPEIFPLFGAFGFFLRPSVRKPPDGRSACAPYSDNIY